MEMNQQSHKGKTYLHCLIQKNEPTELGFFRVSQFGLAVKAPG